MVGLYLLHLLWTTFFKRLLKTSSRSKGRVRVRDNIGIGGRFEVAVVTQVGTTIRYYQAHVNGISMSKFFMLVVILIVKLYENFHFFL